MSVIYDHLGTWLATTVVAFLTIFSDKIAERIRFSLNRADLRVKYFEKMAVDLSTYLFWVEMLLERYEKDWDEDIDDFNEIVSEYNIALTTLRSMEFVYRSWIKKYWKEDAVIQFGEVINALKVVDNATHAFNDEGEKDSKVKILEEELKILQEKVDLWLFRAIG